MVILSRAAIVAAVLLTPAYAYADLSSALKAIERRDFDAAIRELAPLAKSGDAEAQYQLGTLYANGDGVPQSYDAAKGLFNAAASQGNGRARHALDFLAEIGAIALAAAPAGLPGGPARPGATPAAAGPASPAGAVAAVAPGATPPAAPGDLRLQLGTVPTEGGAASEARRVARRFQTQLAGVAVTSEPFQTAAGDVVYRVLTPPLAEPQAREICQQIRSENGNCLLIKP